MNEPIAVNYIFVGHREKNNDLWQLENVIKFIDRVTSYTGRHEMKLVAC